MVHDEDAHFHPDGYMIHGHVYTHAEYVLKVPKNENVKEVFLRTVRLPTGYYLEFKQYTILQLAD